MEVRANLKYLRVAPRKVRLVTNLIRGLNVQDALDQLLFVNKRSAKAISKLIQSAVANAEHNFELNKNNLYIKSLRVDQGPILYRWMPRAMGRATQIRKKTSHVWLILDERVPSKTARVPRKMKTSEVAEIIEPKTIKKAVKSISVKPNDEKIEEAYKDKKGQKIFDVRMKGKHRNIQHMDQKEKKSKGFIKKIFSRKTGS